MLKKTIGVSIALMLQLLACQHPEKKTIPNEKLKPTLDSMSKLYIYYNSKEQSDSIVDLCTSALQFILKNDSVDYKDSTISYYLRRASSFRRMGAYARAWSDYQSSLHDIGNDSSPASKHFKYGSFYGLATLFYYYNQQDINLALDYLDSATNYRLTALDTANVMYFKCEANIAKGKYDAASEMLTVLSKYVSRRILKGKSDSNCIICLHFKAFLIEDKAKIAIGQRIGYSQDIVDTLDKCISLNRSIDSVESNKYQIASILFDKSDYLISWHKYDGNSIRDLKEAFDLSDKISFNYVKMKSAGLLSKYYNVIGDTVLAKFYHKNFVNLKENLFDSYTRTQEERLRSEKEAAALSERRESVLYKKNSTFIKRFLVGIIIFVIVLSLGLFEVARRRFNSVIGRGKKELLEASDELDQRDSQLKDIQSKLTERTNLQSIQEEILKSVSTSLEGKNENDLSKLCELCAKYFESTFCGIVTVLDGSFFSSPTLKSLDDNSMLKEVFFASLNLDGHSVFYPNNLLNNKNSNTWREIIDKLASSGVAKNCYLVDLKYEGDLSDEKNNLIGLLCFIDVDESNFFVPEIELIRTQLSHLLTLGIDKEKSNRGLRDTTLISNLREGNYSFEEILKLISSHLIAEFNLATVSFRVPSYSGETVKKKSLTNIIFSLRYVLVDPKIKEKKDVDGDKLAKHFWNERAFFKITDINYESIIGAAISKKVIFDSDPDKKPIDPSIIRRGVFNTDCKIVLPIVKNAYATLNYPDEEAWKSILGIFDLRPYDEPAYEIAERLQYLSANFSDIFNSLLHKNKHDQFEKLKAEFDELKYDPKTFYKQIVNLIARVLNSEVCSVFVHDGSKNRLVLKATTAERVKYNNEEKKIEEFKRLDEIYYSIDDSDSIIVRAFNEHESFQILTIKEFPHSSKYLELLTGSGNDSVMIMPIKEKTDSSTVIGVIKCARKTNVFNDLHEEFWHFELETLRLISSILYRFIENIELDKIKDSFIHSVVHESLTPITQMMNLSGNLVLRIDHEHMKLPLDFEKFFKSLKDSIYLFKHVIVGLEDVIRESEDTFNLERSNVNLRELLLSAVRLFDYTAMTEQKYIKTSISDLGDIKLNIDKNKMLQVFINLLRNAITYSYEGKEIEIYYKIVSDTVNGVNGKWHEVKFQNYGIGILPSDKDSIFDLYARGKNAQELKPQGRGIGLYLVRKIMRAHRGDCLVRRLKNPTIISILFQF